MVDASPFKHATADESPGFLLWKLTALWQGALAAVFAEFGITQTQYAILASLRWFEARGEPITQRHLVAHAKLDKMTLSKAIRRLEEVGLVKRTPSATDGRATEVRFSTRGREITEAAIVAVEAADDRFFTPLSATDLARYKSLALALIRANELRES